MLLALSLYGFDPQESQQLLEAIELAGCHIETTSASLQEALVALDKGLQKCFIRPSGLEREQFADKFTNKELRTKLLPKLTAFTKAMTYGAPIPTKLLLGASETTASERLKILVDLEKSGNHANTIYLLGGKRDLWIDAEPMAKTILMERLVEKLAITKAEAELIIANTTAKFFPDNKNVKEKRMAIVKHFTDQDIVWPTETDMLKRLAHTHKELAKSNIITIDTPKQLNKNGQLVRPNTADTFYQFWAEHGATITKLATIYPNKKLPIAIVTNQPYGLYQYQSALATLNNKPVSISVVASAHSENINLSIVFDSIARIVRVGKGLALKKIEVKEQKLCKAIN